VRPPVAPSAKSGRWTRTANELFVVSARHLLGARPGRRFPVCVERAHMARDRQDERSRAVAVGRVRRSDAMSAVEAGQFAHQG